MCITPGVLTVGRAAPAEHGIEAGAAPGDERCIRGFATVRRRVADATIMLGEASAIMPS